MGDVERGRVLALVLSGLNAVLAEAKKTPPEPPGETTLLAGRGAVLDSLGLVSLVVDLEKRTEEEFGAVLALAQEESESDGEGPFRSVESLTDHLCRLLCVATRGSRVEVPGTGGPPVPTIPEEV